MKRCIIYVFAIVFSACSTSSFSLPSDLDAPVAVGESSSLDDAGPSNDVLWEASFDAVQDGLPEVTSDAPESATAANKCARGDGTCSANFEAFCVKTCKTTICSCQGGACFCI